MSESKILAISDYMPNDIAVVRDKLLNGSRIVDVYLSEEDTGHYIEGGLTFVVEKNGKEHVVVFGYTELGEWIEDIDGKNCINTSLRNYSPLEDILNEL